jgi:hypothetical protein
MTATRESRATVTAPLQSVAAVSATRRSASRTGGRMLRPFVAALSAAAAALAVAEEPAALRDPQSDTQATAPQARRAGRARFFDPADQQLDLSDFLEHPHGVIPIPIVVTEPAVGYGGGAAGLFVRPRTLAGEEGWARPNLSMVGGLVTENGTWAAFAGDASRWRDGRLRTLAGAGAGQANLDFYGAGLDRPQLDQKFRYSLEFTGAIAQANWQLAPKSPWAVGLRYTYANVDPRLRDAPSFPGAADRVRVTISAPTAVLEYDSRDNVFTPARGIYAETSYLAARQALGASRDFERFKQVALGWQSLPHAVTLGGRLSYAWSSDSTPFFFKPYVELRGVPAMRYQGNEVASVELEARWQFSGRWSLVPFAGAGATRVRQIAPADGQRVGSGGIGFRYELARKFGMHAGIDVAHSSGTTAAYFQVGNAWFRP